MARLTEATKGKIRDLPISDRLRTLLLAAAERSSIDTVVVTSGGQCAKGSCTKRTGSTRHDLGNAADLELHKDGRALDFTSAVDLPDIRAFVLVAVRLGATGLGAGVDYMGPRTLHVGFGPPAVWGAGGAVANAPTWLVETVRTARKSDAGFKSMAIEITGSDDPEIEEDAPE